MLCWGFFSETKLEIFLNKNKNLYHTKLKLFFVDFQNRWKYRQFPNHFIFKIQNTHLICYFYQNSLELDRNQFFKKIFFGNKQIVGYFQIRENRSIKQVLPNFLISFNF